MAPLTNQRNRTQEEGRVYQIALAGNPNSGKTTVFNSLTGAKRHVGNYPGVTVERVSGRFSSGDTSYQVVDLPGTYSLSSTSEDEAVARRAIVSEKPDGIINIVDATNFERNLYLTLQILEFGIPTVVALNMADLVEAAGSKIDSKRLSDLLGVPVVTTIGHKGTGLPESVAALKAAVDANKVSDFRVDYGEAIEKQIGLLAGQLKANNLLLSASETRWLAIKLLEDDNDVLGLQNSEWILVDTEKARAEIENDLGVCAEQAIAEKRYERIAEIAEMCLETKVKPGKNATDRIDAIATNRFIGIPLFLGLMYLVFHLTFAIGDYPMGWIEDGFGKLGDWVSSLWPAGSESALKSLIVDGIIGGVGGVLVFLPNILLLFLAIAILEGSGYMARVAFIMDRIMQKLGLHGKSFIPLMVGFGCSIPAIMATRTLENRRDRLTTMLVAPLMSCGARLPIYSLIIPAFFPKAMHATMIWVIYLIGIALAVISAKLLRAFMLKGKTMPLIMELPQYRVPTLKSIFVQMWDRSLIYLKKAGTVILSISVLLWVATTYPNLSSAQVSQFDAQREAISQRSLSDEEKEAALAEVDNRQAELALSHSVAGRIGMAMTPVLRPLGFDWKIGTGLVGAFAAKEVFVAQLGVVYAVGEADEESDSLRAKLKENYTPLVAFCIMVFCLISTPCMATVAVTKRESGSWKWAAFQFFGLTALAYIVTFAIYQVGLFFGLGVG